jgi:hypothetical protein
MLANKSAADSKPKSEARINANGFLEMKMPFALNVEK